MKVNRQKKFMSETYFEKIKKFLEHKNEISRKELCEEFKIFKYNTLKNHDCLNIGIGVSGFSGRSAMYTPERIIAYIEKTYKIISEDDITYGFS